MPPRCGGCCAGAACPTTAVARYVARMREPGALTAALGWYRALPWSCRDPVGTGSGADAARVEHRRRVPRPRGTEATAALRRRAVPARGAPGRRHWIPELAPDVVADLVAGARRALNLVRATMQRFLCKDSFAWLEFVGERRPTTADPPAPAPRRPPRRGDRRPSRALCGPWPTPPGRAAGRAAHGRPLHRVAARRPARREHRVDQLSPPPAGRLRFRRGGTRRERRPRAVVARPAPRAPAGRPRSCARTPPAARWSRRWTTA